MATNGTRSLRYRVVDVFTEEALLGNPLAVLPDAPDLDTATMQRIAKEFNLSETVFIYPPANDAAVARLRIFTPQRELPFAGHPTVGSAFVLIDEGRAPATRFNLEEGVGPVPIRVDQGARPLIWLRTPPIREGRTVDRAEAARAVGLDPDDLLDTPPQVFGAGNPSIFVAARDAAAVDRAVPDRAAYSNILRQSGEDAALLMIFARVSDGAYARLFMPQEGFGEDPATGSATGPLAAYMMRHALVAAKNGTRFVSEQGTKMGRQSFLHVLVNGENGSEGIEVGGYVAPLASGTLTVPVQYASSAR